MPLGSKFKLYDLDSDEDDEDYVPLHDQDSDSERSGDDDNNVRALVDSTDGKGDDEEKKRARKDLWASFQESVANPTEAPEADVHQRRMVKIEKRYRFAGEEVIDVVEVPADSADAKKWPLWKDPDTESQKTLIAPFEPSTSGSMAPSTREEMAMQSGSNTPSSSTTPPAQLSHPATSSEKPAAATRSVAKRPGPRKPKTALVPLPGPSKAKKLTTLDKSAMDWRSHIQAEQELGSSIKDELEAHRRGGGYLEKVEFLKRVEERKEDNLDAMKSTKRRKL